MWLTLSDRYSTAVAKFHNHHNDYVLAVEQYNEHRKSHYQVVSPTCLDVAYRHEVHTADPFDVLANISRVLCA